MRLLFVILLSVAWLSGPLDARGAERTLDFDAVRAERNLEKRSRLALELARGTVEKVVQAYAGGDLQRGVALLDQILEAVELSQQSLKATGKKAYKNPKHFKRAEIETRKLLRDLQGARKELNFDQREHLDEVRGRVSEINSELLMSIMTKDED